MVIQHASVRSIRAEGLCGDDDGWALIMRVDYYWPEVESSELTEVALTVVALDPEGNVLASFEARAGRARLGVDRPEKGIILDLWGAASCDSRRALTISAPLRVMMFPRQHAGQHVGQHARERSEERAEGPQASVSSGRLSRSGPLCERGFIFLASISRHAQVLVPRLRIVPGRAPRHANQRALATIGAGLALSDGCWLWSYSPATRCLLPVCEWCGSVARYEHLAAHGADGLVCALTQGARRFLCLSDTGAIWDIGGPSPVFYEVAGVPLGWGTGRDWTMDCWRNWRGPQQQWGVACGAVSLRSPPRVAKNSAYSFLLERLCLRTEAFSAGVASLADLEGISEDLTFGAPTLGNKDFRGGVVCVWAREGPALSACVSRTCGEVWMREPASEPVYNAGQVAYVDRGGHLVIADLAKGAAVSCRVANPSLHCSQIALCADSAGFPLLIACHANLTASAWRPQSAPGFVLRVEDSRTFVPAGVPYVTCCTWAGAVRWGAALPARALCCSAVDRRVFIGTLHGTLQLDAEHGAFIKHYAQLAAVELLAVDTGAACLLAARSDTGDIRLLEVPKE